MSKSKVSKCCIGVLVVLWAWSYNVRSEQINPDGDIQSPLLGSFDVNTESALIEFHGCTNFPGSIGEVEIQLLTNGEGDIGTTPYDDSRRIVVRPSDTQCEPENIIGLFFDEEFPGSKPRYQWTTGVMFNPFFFDGTSATPWKEGGTARVRGIARITDPAFQLTAPGTFTARFMRVYDKSGLIPGAGALKVNDASEALVLADQLHDSEAINSSLGFLSYPGKAKTMDFEPADKCHRDDPNLTCAENETKRYYASVGTNSDGTGPSIAEELGTLSQFTERYFGTGVPDKCRSTATHVPAEGINAQYYNNGDLGIGRDMHCIQTDDNPAEGCFRETACYVSNYGKVEGDKGVPGFDNFAASKEAFQANKPFAVVGMVERSSMAKDAPNRTFFVVYDFNEDPNDPPLGYKAQLDTKATNTFIPGNCIVCHGTSSRYTTSSKAGGPAVVGAQFLPFDLASFGYFDFDPVTKRSDPDDALSRFSQEGDFLFLNYMIYNTSIGELGEERDPVTHAVTKKSWARELIDGWYKEAHLVDGRFFLFNEKFVPEGWNQDVSSQRLYQEFIGPACRTCHISDEVERKSFRSLALSRDTLVGLSYNFVCQGGTIMPQAEQTAKVLWRGEGIPQFISRLSHGAAGENVISAGCNRNGIPQSSGVSTTGQALVLSPEEVTLETARNYKEQSCACTTQACVEEVIHEFASDLQQLNSTSPTVSEEVMALIHEASNCELQIAGQQ